MNIIKIAGLSFVLLLTSGCSLLMSYQNYTYVPPSTRGVILDSDTNRSISNVLITKPLFDYKITSDTNGSFFIPEDTKHSITLHPMQSQNIPTSYIFILFKSGYEPKICTSGYTNADIQIKLHKDKSYQTLDRNQLIDLYAKYRPYDVWSNEVIDELADGVECLKSLKRYPINND